MSYSVAVVVPTLNEEKFIGQCLDCIIHQTYPFEEMDIMVIDGGSIDQTTFIIERYHQRYSNIRLIQNNKKIQSAAFNIGIDISSAPYVIRLDAHALYKSDYIERSIAGLKASKDRGNVGGRWIIEPSDDTIWAKANALLNCSFFGIGGSAFRVSMKPAYVDSVPFGAFPREIINKVGKMREDLPRAEDNEYNSRIRKAGYKIYFDPLIICSYYARPSLSSSCQQMYANGMSIGTLLFVDINAVRIRHLIPLLFVLFLFFGLFLSIFVHSFAYLYIGGIIIYFICDLMASLLSATKKDASLFFPLLILFPCVHFSYGWGSILGLMTGIKRKL